MHAAGMARTKEFDEERALDAAIGVFAGHGYEGSSTGMLLEAMGIGRQSLYDTYGTHSVCEFGDGDSEVAALNEASGRVLREALERRLREARAAGELAADLPLRHAAQFLSALLSGLRIAARGGSSVQTLRQIAHTAVRGLK
jgi:TetR/AcrR family transcriptional repressor of nem operon